MRVLSSCGEKELPSRGDVRASHCSGSLCRARAPGHSGFSAGGARAQLPQGMWGPPRLGVKPGSPALQGGSLTTGPRGRPQI